MAISPSHALGNLGAIADNFLDVDDGLGDYYIAEDGTAPQLPRRPGATSRGTWNRRPLNLVDVESHIPEHQAGVASLRVVYGGPGPVRPVGVASTR
jgi:hypothetical protein